MYPTKIRTQLIDGLGPWKWPEADHGAWDGPVDDWIVSHRKYIEDLDNRRTVVQAGGNCGLYPALLSQLFDDVVTFEPDPQNFHFLQENTLEAYNIMSFNYALGEKQGKVAMHHLTDYNVGMHQLKEGDDVFLVTLDSVMSNPAMPENVDLLWFDIEGYEYPALLGSLETIKKWTPHIALENANGQILTLLQSLGYVLLGPSKMDTWFVHRDKL